MINLKILVFSDSHNNVSNMIEVVNICKSDTSLIVHLGDMTSDSRRLKEVFADLPLIYVKGNNDYFDVEAQNEHTYIFDGIKCFFTHGHQYGVKSGINGIAVRARALKADIVFFGHTHVHVVDKHNGILYVNPGTIGQKIGGTSTFAIVQLIGGAVASADILSFDPINKKIDFFRK